MKYKARKVPLVLLSFVVCLLTLSSSDEMHGIDDPHHERGPDMKLRHRKGKGAGFGKGKREGAKKLRLSQEIDSLHGQYGVSLPAFAYDYSEYLAGAVIERSSRSDNLYLSMFFVGHRTVDHDWPFDMVSTDEEVIYSWSNAAHKWNISSTQTNHRLTDASDKRSGIVCVMQGQGFPRTYTVPAHWVVHTQTAADSSTNPITGTFEILRCPIRGSNSAIYENLSQSDGSLYVDLVRLKERNRSGAGGGAGGAAKANRHQQHQQHQRHRNRNLLNTDDRTQAFEQSLDQANADFITSHRNVIISFHVPWKSRQVGYGVNFQSQPLAGNFDMWRASTEFSYPNTQEKSSSNSVAGSMNLRGNLQTPEATLYVCSGAMRPLNAHRADAGLPMLLEFVEHHISIGVKHIFLGVALDWDSPLMKKYLLVLQSYLDQGQVSISSLALPGFDDVMGFSGIRLNDKYANLFFMNQCLYLSKGIADFVVPLKPSQFLLLPKDTSLTDTLSAVKAAENSNVVNEENKHPQSFCNIPTDLYWLPDPPGTFGHWGPADSTFSGEFFADSVGKGPLVEAESTAPGDYIAPSLMSTDHAWLANDRVGLVCGGGHTYIPSFKRKMPKKFHNENGADSSVAPLNIEYYKKNNHVFKVWHLVEKVPKMHRKTAPTADSEPIMTALKSVHASLSDAGLGSPSLINSKVDANALNITSLDKQPQLRKQMKKPFWLSADVDHLNDVLSAVFQTRKDP